MKFEHKAVVIPAVGGHSDDQLRQKAVQECLDRHQEWRLVSTASWVSSIVLFFAREV
jgi:hypothetical protein